MLPLKSHVGLGLLLVALASSPARAQAYYLNFNKQALALPSRTLYVEQVLDGRLGKPAIGTVYSGLGNKLTVVQFQQGLEPELTAWLQQQLPQRPTDYPVVLCVRQLRVSEAVNSTSAVKGAFTKAVSSAELAADAYVHLTDGYHLLGSVADHLSRPGIDMNSDHSAHVATLFERCIAQLGTADWSAAQQRPARTLNQIVVARPSAVARPAVLRAAAPRAGVYHSFEQFLTNRPDTTLQLRLDTVRWSAVRASMLDPNGPLYTATGMGNPGYSRSVVNSPSGWKGTVQLKAKARTSGGERVAAREIWGFSDGRQAYLRDDNVYRPLTRQGDFYTYVGSAPVDMAAGARRSWGGQSAPSRPTTGRGDTNDNSGEPKSYSLDLRTGQTAPFPPLGQPHRADTAFVYVYRPPGGAADIQRILLNEREVGQLRPGEYLELTCPHYGDAVRLSVDLPAGPALLLVPDATTPNYVKLLPATTAMTPWQLMPMRQGQKEVDALDKLRK